MDHCAVRIFCVFSRPVPPTQGDAFPAVSKIGNQSECVGPRVFGGLPLAEQQCSTINDPGEGLNHKPPKFPSSDPSSRNRSVTYTQIVHTIKIVEITYDPAKNARNIQERSLSFDRAIDFDFHTALYRVNNPRIWRDPDPGHGNLGRTITCAGFCGAGYRYSGDQFSESKWQGDQAL